MKIADSERDKAQKRMQSLASNMFGLGLSMQLAQGGAGGLGLATNAYQQVSHFSFDGNFLFMFAIGSKHIILT